MTTAMQLLHHGISVFIVPLLFGVIVGITGALASALAQSRQRKRLPAPFMPCKRPYNEPAWKTHDVEIEVLQDVMQYAVAGEGTKFYLVRCYSCEAMLLAAQWPAKGGSHYEPNSSAAIRVGWNYHEIPGVGSKFLCPNHTRAVRELLAPNV